MIKYCLLLFVLFFLLVSCAPSNGIHNCSENTRQQIADYLGEPDWKHLLVTPTPELCEEFSCLCVAEN
jgi:hypothetical protein